MLSSLAQYPNDADVLYAAYRARGLRAKSLASLVKVAPDSARLHQVTAELLESDGDYPHAVDQYRRALAANRRFWAATALDVAILNSSQEAEARAEAGKEFEAALKLNPRDERGISTGRDCLVGASAGRGDGALCARCGTAAEVRRGAVGTSEGVAAGGQGAGP